MLTYSRFFDNNIKIRLYSIVRHKNIIQVDLCEMCYLMLQIRLILEDPLNWHGGVKAAWTSALFNAQTQLASGISRIKLPFITIHGTDDQLVNIASSQFLFDNAQSEDKTFEVQVIL